MMNGLFASADDFIATYRATAVNPLAYELVSALARKVILTEAAAPDTNAFLMGAATLAKAAVPQLRAEGRILRGHFRNSADVQLLAPPVGEFYPPTLERWDASKLVKQYRATVPEPKQLADLMQPISVGALAEILSELAEREAMTQALLSRTVESAAPAAVERAALIGNTLRILPDGYREPLDLLAGIAGSPEAEVSDDPNAQFYHHQFQERARFFLELHALWRDGGSKVCPPDNPEWTPARQLVDEIAAVIGEELAEFDPAYQQLAAQRSEQHKAEFRALAAQLTPQDLYQAAALTAVRAKQFAQVASQHDPDYHAAVREVGRVAARRVPEAPAPAVRGTSQLPL